MIPRKKVLWLLWAGVLGSLIFGSSQMKSGVGLGFLGSVSLYMTYIHTPLWLKKAIVKCRIFIDIGISIGIYMYMGRTGAVTALMSAATMEVMVSLLLGNEHKLLYPDKATIIRNIS